MVTIKNNVQPNWSASHPPPAEKNVRAWAVRDVSSAYWVAVNWTWQSEDKYATKAAVAIAPVKFSIAMAKVNAPILLPEEANQAKAKFPLSWPKPVTNNDFPPTDQDEAVRIELTEKVNLHLANYNKLISSDLEAFNIAFAKLKLDYLTIK